MRTFSRVISLQRHGRHRLPVPLAAGARGWVITVTGARSGQPGHRVPHRGPRACRALSRRRRSSALPVSPCSLICSAPPWRRSSPRPRWRLAGPRAPAWVKGWVSHVSSCRLYAHGEPAARDPGLARPPSRCLPPARTSSPFSMFGRSFTKSVRNPAKAGTPSFKEDHRHATKPYASSLRTRIVSWQSPRKSEPCSRSSQIVPVSLASNSLTQPKNVGNATREARLSPLVTTARFQS